MDFLVEGIHLHLQVPLDHHLLIVLITQMIHQQHHQKEIYHFHIEILTHSVLENTHFHLTSVYPLQPELKVALHLQLELITDISLVEFQEVKLHH